MFSVIQLDLSTLHIQRPKSQHEGAFLFINPRHLQRTLPCLHVHELRPLVLLVRQCRLVTELVQFILFLLILPFLFLSFLIPLNHYSLLCNVRRHTFLLHSFRSKANYCQFLIPVTCRILLNLIIPHFPRSSFLCLFRYGSHYLFCILSSFYFFWHSFVILPLQYIYTFLI